MDSCPKDLEPYDLSLKLQMKRQDEMNYYNALYELRAFQVALSQFGAGLAGKNSKAEFYKEPILSKALEDNGLTQEEIDDRELRKMLLYEEMWQRQHKKNGLKEVEIL